MNRKSFGMPPLLIIATFALAACGAAATQAPPAVAPSPTAAPPIDTPAPAATTQTDMPLPTAATSTTATPDVALLQIPSVRCCRGRDLEAGRYVVPSWLDIPLTLEVGPGWRVLNERAARLFALGRGQNVHQNPGQIISFLNVTGRITPDALIDSVQRAPELTSATKPISVTLAGFPGVQLDSAAKPNPSYAGSKEEDIPPGVQFLPVFTQYFTPGFSWTTSSPEARIRTVALTMEDRTLLLYLEAPPDEFDQFAADADAILQSLKLIEK